MTRIARGFRIGFVALYLLFIVVELLFGFTRVIALGVALALAALSASFLTVWVAILIRQRRDRPVEG